jgi:hypothetical protein
MSIDNSVKFQQWCYIAKSAVFTKVRLVFRYSALTVADSVGMHPHKEIDAPNWATQLEKIKMYLF